jgi:hypothetical protein
MQENFYDYLLSLPFKEGGLTSLKIAATLEIRPSRQASCGKLSYISAFGAKKKAHTSFIS